MSDHEDAVITGQDEAADSAETLRQQLEAVNRRMADLQKSADGYRAQVETMLGQQKIDRRNAAIEAAAGQARAAVPADVVVWAERFAADALANTLRGDGTVDAAAVTALVERCRGERRAWFTPTGAGVPSNRGGSVPDLVGERLKRAFGDKSLFRL